MSADEIEQAFTAWQDALAGLDSIKKNDLVEIKNMKTPPKRVQSVLTCVATLKSLKGADTFSCHKMMLNDTSFLNSLRTIDCQDVKVLMGSHSSRTFFDEFRPPLP